ncbi:MAG: phosphatidate cytidylyltransferase [Prolixibacteraceae bacterium]|nr:phosphatidate cytidylyltransferase [Prolixibacteraceae bacterium]
MIRIIYLIILSYFILGGIGFIFINRKKEPEAARRNWIKFITYCVIIHIVFFSIVINPLIFKILAAIIIIMGIYELFNLFRNSDYSKKRFFFLSLIVYCILSSGFIIFSRLDKELILFSFLVIAIFDSFSQISGQLWGKRKIMPAISPGKTLGGLMGGAVIAVLSSLLFKGLLDISLQKLILTSAGIVIFAFIGDSSASFYKRKYKVKDFNNLIPGHGGFLDRFDSLITGGVWIGFCEYFFN